MIKMNKSKIFMETPTLKQKLWFYLTCFRPISKYEFIKLQSQLVIILEGIRESDLQHFQTEKAIVDEIKKLVNIVQNNGSKKQSEKDNDEKHMYE